MQNNENFYVAAANVFANFAFLTPLPDGKKENDSKFIFRINFSKERTGKLYMVISEKLLDSIHSIVSDEEADKKETGKELLNILCGNILSEVFTDKKAFKLCPPEICSSIDEQNPDFKADIFFDSGNVELFMFLKEN